MLKTTIETLEGISKELQELYEETDNGYILKVEGIDDHPDVKGLKSAYRKEKENREAAESKLNAIPKDFDPDQWEKVKSGKAKEEDLIALRKELEAERDKWKQKAQDLEGQTYKLTVSQQLDDLLKSNGITNPVYQKAARALLADGIKLEDGKAVVDTDMGPVELKDHVKRWVSSEGSAFVEPAKGGGAGGGKASEKQVTLETFKGMGEKERVALYNDNPEHFKQLSDQLKRN